MQQEARPLRPLQKGLSLATPRTVSALILREMTTTYGRSPGGYLWLILEPVAGVLVLTLAFAGFGLTNPALGGNFPIFFATGMLPFLMFTRISGVVAQAINYSRQLIAYPRVTFLDALLARFVLATLTELLVFYVVITAILTIWDTRTTLVFGEILLALGMATALAAGVGTLNCFLITMFPIWQQVWSIAMRPAFLASGIFFLLENIPQPARDWLWWNPLMHVTAEMRRAFYISYDPAWVSPAYVFGLSLGLMLLGLVFLRRHHRDMLDR